MVRFALALLLGLLTTVPLLAAGPSQHDQKQGEQKKEDGEGQPLSREAKFAMRFPQPVKVGDLIGLPLLDYDDATLGYVTDVVRTKEGDIVLTVPYGRWFGWVKLGGPFDWNRRVIGVRIEDVEILAKQLNSDASREDIDEQPAFDAAGSTPMARHELVKIPLGRR